MAISARNSSVQIRSNPPKRPVQLACSRQSSSCSVRACLRLRMRAAFLLGARLRSIASSSLRWSLMRSCKRESRVSKQRWWASILRARSSSKMRTMRGHMFLRTRHHSASSLRALLLRPRSQKRCVRSPGKTIFLSMTLQRRSSMRIRLTTMSCSARAAMKKA